MRLFLIRTRQVSMTTSIYMFIPFAANCFQFNCISCFPFSLSDAINLEDSLTAIFPFTSCNWPLQRASWLWSEGDYLLFSISQLISKCAGPYYRDIFMLSLFVTHTKLHRDTLNTSSQFGFQDCSGTEGHQIINWQLISMFWFFILCLEGLAFIRGQEDGVPGWYY